MAIMRSLGVSRIGCLAKPRPRIQLTPILATTPFATRFQHTRVPPKPAKQDDISERAKPTIEYKYPGLGLNLHYVPGYREPQHPRGMGPNTHEYLSQILFVREVAMMILMDLLTDKPDWNQKVFDESIVEKWTREALKLPPEPLWKEVVDHYDPTGPWNPKDFEHFKASPPNPLFTEEMVAYCINELRDKAEYMQRSGLVPVLDTNRVSVVKSDTVIDEDHRQELVKAFNKLKAEQADNPDWHPGSNEMVRNLVHPSMYPLVWGRSRIIREPVVGVADAVGQWLGKGDVREADVSQDRDKYIPSATDYWSKTYQWLPSNVAFQDDGPVKFTSYVNNLHPTKHPDIYRIIEKLIEKALPAWDQCLTGRSGPRFSEPENPADENRKNWYDTRPEGIVYDPAKDPEYDDFEYEDPDYREEYIEERLFTLFRRAKHPNPLEYIRRNYDVDTKNTLKERFRDTGLQIIVKMASIELTPDKPSYPGGNWHLEGQLNEQIIGTALYYLDSENITSSRLSFRMSTDAEWVQMEYEVPQDEYSWLESVYGTDLHDGGAAFHNYGSVETKQGRLLAFPNVFQHRATAFELKDKTKPGHRKFVALWLVDPLIRIISTANVPPQQAGWAEGSAPDVDLDGEKQWPMTHEEAIKHRDALMEERGLAQKVHEDQWYERGYSFCEH